MLDSRFPNYSEITRRPKPNLELSDSTLKYFSGKKVLVTGAGGSIGSRIAAQLSKIPNVHLILTDRDENALHTLSLGLTEKALFDDPNYALLDIRDEQGVKAFFGREKFDVVIHSAALKHLSALEKQPREAVLTNVIGTNNLIQAAKTNGVTGFLNISTDKAADPVSVLGRSKLASEILTTLSRTDTNQFTSVRFGNVFASKGSVIETFCFQINQQIPITLTHRDMTRYFMDVEEAAFLAVTSLSLNSGPVHLLDMGLPIRISEIIESLQAHFSSNLTVMETGLRPGEKINEDLLSRYENSHLTDNPRIYSLTSDFPPKEFVVPLANLSDNEAISILDQLS